MANMFGRPENPITEDPVLTRVPEAPNLFIAYPVFDDWVGLYEFQYTRPGREAQLSAREAQNRIRYDDMKGSHERSVMNQLTVIIKKETAQAVLAEIALATAAEVTIYPFDFIRSSQWKVGRGAITSPVSQQDAWVKDLPIAGQNSRGKPYVSTNRSGKPRVGTGAGSDTNIFYTPRRHTTPDDTLLHELVHASRHMHGVLYRMPVSASYGNLEEFLAETIANMYRAEKGKALLDYNDNPIKAAGFLDGPINPTPRVLLAYMKSKQPKLFKRLADLNVPFNPMKQVAAEEDAYLRKIEQM